MIVPITFSDLKNNYVGVCISYIDGRKEIEIDSAFWNEAEDLIKEELIFHELGHCILNRGHDNTMVEAVGYPYKIPNSIMNRYVFGHSRFYRQFHDHYIEELLNPGKQL